MVQLPGVVSGATSGESGSGGLPPTRSRSPAPTPHRLPPRYMVSQLFEGSFSRNQETGVCQCLSCYRAR